MSRYTFTHKIDHEIVLYAESTFEEEELDVIDSDIVSTGFSGNGYLAFWTRCQGMLRDWKRDNPSTDYGTSLIADNWYDKEKRW